MNNKYVSTVYLVERAVVDPGQLHLPVAAGAVDGPGGAELLAARQTLPHLLHVIIESPLQQNFPVDLSALEQLLPAAVVSALADRVAPAGRAA